MAPVFFELKSNFILVASSFVIISPLPFNVSCSTLAIALLKETLLFFRSTATMPFNSTFFSVSQFWLLAFIKWMYVLVLSDAEKILSEKLPDAVNLLK
ncbi:MAG: hypothetical protein IPJ79_15095 [Bacteroidetes bacterium]|nr:hypothetical protein [Bacteroidota bacterium]